MPNDKILEDLIINKLTPEQFAPIIPSDSEIYLVEDDVEYASVDELNQGLSTKQDTISDLSTIRSNAQTGANLAPQVAVNTQRIEDLTTARIPDVIYHGTPKITGGQISNFSTINYLQFPFEDISRGLPFDIYFSFTTDDDVTTQQNIIDSKFGIALAILNGKGVMALSSNGTSWDIGSVTGTFTLSANTTYYVKYSWTGTEYKTYISTNNIFDTTDMVLPSTLSPYKTTIYIGGCDQNSTSHTPHPFKGIINFTKSRVDVNGITVWEGMADVGIASRANVSLTNLDDVGEKRFTDLQEAIDTKQPAGDYATNTRVNEVEDKIPTNNNQLTNGAGYITSSYHDTTKQDTLVSGTNIKTINGESVLGSGDLEIATKTDNITINTNDNQELQTIGLIENNKNIPLKTWVGTREEFKDGINPNSMFDRGNANISNGFAEYTPDKGSSMYLDPSKTLYSDIVLKFMLNDENETSYHILNFWSNPAVYITLEDVSNVLDISDNKEFYLKIIHKGNGYEGIRYAEIQVYTDSSEPVLVKNLDLGIFGTKYIGFGFVNGSIDLTKSYLTVFKSGSGVFTQELIMYPLDDNTLYNVEGYGVFLGRKKIAETISDLTTIRQNADDGRVALIRMDRYGDIVTHNANEFQLAGNYVTEDTLEEHTGDTTIHVTSEEKNNWSNKQDALVSGTNIKTINNESILGNGDIIIKSEDNIYECKYNETTYSEIIQAIDDDKIPIVKKDNQIYFYCHSNETFCYFSRGYATDSYYLICTVNNIWTSAHINLESISHKVISISSDSTDVQYPSAKCVYDNLNNKQDTLISGTNIKTINDESIIGSGNISIETIFQKSSTTTSTISLTKNNSIYKITPSSATTFVFDISQITISANEIVTFELRVNMSSVQTLTFPSSVRWLNNEAPDLSETGIYYLVFRTDDKGATWIGNLQGLWV